MRDESRDAPGKNGPSFGSGGKKLVKIKKRRLKRQDARVTRERCCDPENGRPCRCRVSSNRRRA